MEYLPSTLHLTLSAYLLTAFLKTQYRWTQVTLSVLSLIDMFIVSRLNIKYGFSDKMMSLWGSALGDAINQFKYANVLFPYFDFVFFYAFQAMFFQA